MIATQEFVVPKSIPIIFAISNISALCHEQAAYKPKVHTVTILEFFIYMPITLYRDLKVLISIIFYPKILGQ